MEFYSSYFGYFTYFVSKKDFSAKLFSQEITLLRFTSKGNNIRLFHFRPAAVEAGVSVTISVPMTEQFWQREDGRPADREHMLMALADLEFIMIKATYSSNTQESA